MVIGAAASWVNPGRTVDDSDDQALEPPIVAVAEGRPRELDIPDRRVPRCVNWDAAQAISQLDVMYGPVISHSR